MFYICKDIQIVKIYFENRGYLDEILEKCIFEVYFIGREKLFKNKENVGCSVCWVVV